MQLSRVCRTRQTAFSLLRVLSVALAVGPLLAAEVEDTSNLRAMVGVSDAADSDLSLPPDMVWLPEGEGRETVYYSCSACHSIRLVAQQGLPRDRWQELLEWMVEEQGMRPLEQSVEQVVLDYLAEHLGVEQH